MNINQACIIPLVGWLFLAYPILGILPLASSIGKSTEERAATVGDHTEEVRRLGHTAPSNIDPGLQRPFQSNPANSRATGTHKIPHPEREAVADSTQAKKVELVVEEILKIKRQRNRLPKKRFWSRLKNVIRKKQIERKLKKAIETVLINQPQFLSVEAHQKAALYGMSLKLDGETLLNHEEEREVDIAWLFIHEHRRDLLSL